MAFFQIFSLVRCFFFLKTDSEWGCDKINETETISYKQRMHFYSQDDSNLKITIFIIKFKNFCFIFPQ